MLIDDFTKVAELIGQLRVVRENIELLSERTGLAVVAEVEGSAHIRFRPDGGSLSPTIRSVVMSQVWDLLLKELHYRDRAICRQLIALGVEVEPYDKEPIDG